SILRHLVERELTHQIRSGAVADDAVGLQFHWSIIKEFGSVRQYLSYKSNAIISFHRLDLHINIDIAGTEQQLPGWCSNSAHSRQHGLIVGVEHQGRDELPQAADHSLRLHHRLEQIDAPLN